jgi:hypothetical protein
MEAQGMNWPTAQQIDAAPDDVRLYLSARAGWEAAQWVAQLEHMAGVVKFPELAERFRKAAAIIRDTVSEEIPDGTELWDLKV